MPTADQIKLDSHLFTLHVGDSGSGKTSAAAFYPTPIYWFDLDKRFQGCLGVRLIAEDRERLKKIHVDTYDSMNLDGIVGALDKKIDVLLAQKGSKFPYKTVVFDGLSSAANWFLDDGLKLAGDIRYVGSTKDASTGHKTMGAISLPGYDQWAYEQAAFTKIMLALKELPCNVVVTAHWTDRYNEKGEIVGKQVNLRPKVAPHVLKWFNEVYYFEKRVIPGTIPGIGTVQKPIYKVAFRNELARTAFLELPFECEWTDRDFFVILTDSLNKENKELITAGENK